VRSGLSTLASLVIVDDEQALLAQHPGARRQDIARLAHALWDEVRESSESAALRRLGAERQRREQFR